MSDIIQNTFIRSKKSKPHCGSTFRKILSHGEKSMTSHLFSKLALATAATVILMTPAYASKDTQAETLVKKMYQQAFTELKKTMEPLFDDYVKKYGTKEFAKIWQCGEDHLSVDGAILFDTDPLFFCTQVPEIKPKTFEIKALAGDELVAVSAISAQTGNDSYSGVYVVTCDEGKCKISDFIYSFGSAKYTIIEAYPECMTKN